MATDEAAVRLPRKNLVRACMPGVELREAASSESSLGTMTLRWLVFDERIEVNSRYEGRFIESFAPGSVARTIKNNGDEMRVLLQHGKDPQAGLKPLGPLSILHEDAIGAYGEVPLLDTSYCRDIAPGIAAGLYGSSFRFSVLDETVVQRPKPSAANPDGIPERRVNEARVYELGPVLWGAYMGASAGMRSITDLVEDVDAMTRATPILLDDQRMGHARAFISRSLPTAPEPGDVAGDASAGSASRVGPATTTHVIEGVTGFAHANYSHPVAAQPVGDNRQRRYDRITEYVGRAIWAMHPSALAIIQGIVGERAAGHRATPDEIRSRIATHTSERDMMPMPEPDDDDGDGSVIVGQVRVLSMVGSIVPHASMCNNVSGGGGVSIEDLQDDLADAIDDDTVTAIVLDIDSPGGSVDLVPEFAAQIMASRGSKPIIAQANAFAASAAYWIAAACDEIVVSPSGQVGSIGVYTMHTDHSAADELAGEKVTLISAAPYKTEGNPYQPLSEAAAAEMQRRVDAYYQMFLEAVATGRGTDTATVEATYGGGRMVMATDAVTVGMADRVATISETLQRLSVPAEESTDLDNEDAPTIPDNTQPDEDEDAKHSTAPPKTEPAPKTSTHLSGGARRSWAERHPAQPKTLAHIRRKQQHEARRPKRTPEGD